MVLLGQGITGQISGTVSDSSGGAVVGTKVELLNSGTAQTREGSTDSSGVFLFTELLPGQYTVKVTSAGFKTYSQQGIVVTATERVALRPIQLQLGAVSDSVSVTAEAAKVATQSAERSGSVSSSELLAAPVKGRNYLALLATVPGVILVLWNSDSPSGGIGDVRINGSRGESLSLNLDGVPNMDTGNQNGSQATPSMEAIGELKVLTTNYQAEYGRSHGGTINAVIKSGSSAFHGGAYYFKRNEALNANDFFKNRDGLPRTKYRYDFPGYFIGGPALIPGLVKSRDKLFFFWSQEFLPRVTPTGLSRFTFPTTLERNGDFSQTVDTNGRVIPIFDPLNGGTQFPNNVIPTNRIDTVGQALLNQFPLPNTVDPSHTFNSVFQNKTKSPHRFEVLRTDWNVDSKTIFYVRAHQNIDTSASDICCGNSFPIIRSSGGSPARGIVGTVIRTFSTTLVNETSFGVNSFKQYTRPDPATLAKADRTKLGVNFPQFHPENNIYNVLPNASYGGVQNAPSINWDSRFPFSGTNNVWAFTNNISKSQGRHNLKAGIYVEKVARNSVAWSGSQSYFGTVSFGKNTNNPLDTNYAFSNGLLGSINSYTESNTRPYSHARYLGVEGFVQDNWRVTKRLTVDLGVRLYHIQPTKIEDGLLASFDPSLYDAAKAPKLVRPYIATPGGPRVGYNPATNQIVPAVLIGSYAAGSGQFFTGMRTYKESLMDLPGLTAAPRFGFSLDVFGNGKTALRGGFGIFPGRLADDQTTQFMSQPPVYQMMNFYNLTIKDLAATPATITPSGVSGIENSFNPPTVYNWSFGIQQDIGFSTVLDVAYVASVGRHLHELRNLNAVRYGTNFLPSSIDPTVSGNKPYALDFLRPMPSFGDVAYNEFSGTSNYQSMQVLVSRRFRQNLAYSVAWTWSKIMDLTDYNDYVNPFIDPKIRNYGKAGYDRTHTLVANVSYPLPTLSKGWSNAFTRAALDNWEIAGIATFLSGNPSGISYSLVGPDLAGGGGAGVNTRVDLSGNPVLSRGERNIYRAFRTEAIVMPIASAGIGTAPKDVFRGPGLNNWDLSVYKNIPLWKDSSKRLQFRMEAYNAFNHAQFNGVDTGARFDTAGKQINARFGQYNSARDGRRVQLGAKFYF